MRYLFIFLILAGCSSPHKSLLKSKKYWDKIQTELLKYPEIADSLELVKHDTIKVEGFKTEVDDSTSWTQEFLFDADSLSREVVKADEKKKPVVILQNRICPTLTKDSIYYIKVFNSELSLYVPVQLSIKAKGGKISVKIWVNDVRIPEPKVTKEIEFKSVEKRFFQDQWFWVAVILFLVWAAFVALSLRRG